MPKKPVNVNKKKTALSTLQLKDNKKSLKIAQEMAKPKSSFPAVFEILKLPPVDYNDPIEVAERIEAYFKICYETEITPTRETLGLAFKVNRTSIHHWAAGRTKSMPLEVIEMIRLACSTIDAALVQDSLEYNGNPAFRIFLMRNNRSGYTNDDDKLDSQPIDYDAPERTVEEIARKYREISSD